MSNEETGKLIDLVKLAMVRDGYDEPDAEHSAPVIVGELTSKYQLTPIETNGSTDI